MSILTTSLGKIGINFATGQMSNYIPDIVGIPIVNDWNITNFKFFWHSIDQLEIISQNIPNANVILGLTNNDLINVAYNEQEAINLLHDFQLYNNIIDYVCIGNEPDVSFPTKDLSFLLPNAFQNINKALQKLNMKAKATTPFTMGIFGWEQINPPENTRFSNEWNDLLHSILDILDKSNSTFMINTYPYLSWLNHKELYSFDYSLGNTTSLYFNKYTCLFDQQLDAIRYALNAAGYPNMKFMIGETGWPTFGREGATIENANYYINTLFTHDRNITIFIFEAFDESRKPGDKTEHNYGLAYENGTLKFNIKN
jgi:hypothetical protein